MYKRVPTLWFLFPFLTKFWKIFPRRSMGFFLPFFSDLYPSMCVWTNNFGNFFTVKFSLKIFAFLSESNKNIYQKTLVIILISIFIIRHLLFCCTWRFFIQVTSSGSPAVGRYWRALFILAPSMLIDRPSVVFTTMPAKGKRLAFGNPPKVIYFFVSDSFPGKCTISFCSGYWFLVTL